MCSREFVLHRAGPGSILSNLYDLLSTTKPGLIPEHCQVCSYVFLPPPKETIVSYKTAEKMSNFKKLYFFIFNQSWREIRGFKIW